MTTMIETENLGRYFGEIKAVDGVSFSVKKGEVLGFLGPNGAGKSTTMKLLTCFLTPSFGTARVCGFDIQTESREVRQRLGYLPENAPLYGEMSVSGYLRFIAEIRGLDKPAIAEALERVTALTSLSDVYDRRIETLSKGFRRRVGLAQAILHNPEILILDEPTDGLDPNQKHEVRELIRKMAAEKSIILSTHILEEVDEVCTRVVIIAKGKVVADSTPEELRSRSPRSGAVTLTLSAEPAHDPSEILRGLPGVKALEETRGVGGGRGYVILPRPGSNLLPEIIRVAEAERWEMRDLRLEAGHLDEVFRTITQ